MLDTLYNFTDLILFNFGDVFNNMSLTLGDFVATANSPVVDFFYNLVTFGGLVTFLDNVTVISLLIGSSLTVVLVVNFLKWLIAD